MNEPSFVQMVVRLGAPAGSDAAIAEFWAATDKNEDGLLCAIDLPDNPGNLTYFFTLFDNAAQVPG
jgi:hypothetical protein